MAMDAMHRMVGALLLNLGHFSTSKMAQMEAINSTTGHPSLCNRQVYSFKLEKGMF
jgi:hypothetical protein